MSGRVAWAGQGFQPLHREHVVQLYERDEQLVATITAYAVRALRREEAFLFVATLHHRRMFEASLAAADIDVAAALASGQLRFVDAAQLLPTLMTGDAPGEPRFLATATQLVTQMRQGSRYARVHVFGELVDLTWRAGNVFATLRLEQLWNEVRKQESFTLYCGFQVTEPVATLLEGPMGEIVATHSSLVPPPSPMSGGPDAGRPFKRLG